jgi:tetratricopeptide (TPR) repeat protein
MHFIKKFKALSIFVLFAAVSTWSMVVFAQVNEQAKAKIEGTVLNPDNQPVADAKIQLKHSETGKFFNLASNKKGIFSGGDLIPGNYTLKCEKSGYKTYTFELQLPPATVQKIDITLAYEDTMEQKKQKEALSFFEKGVNLTKEDKTEEAIKEFRKALELKPDFGEAYLNMGILLFQGNKDEEAEKALLKVLELKPDEPKSKEVLADIYFEKGRGLVQENKPEEALSKLKQAYGFRPDHAYVNFLLGYLYFNKDMKEEAIRHFEAFLLLEPNSPNAEKAKQALARLKK